MASGTQELNTAERPFDPTLDYLMKTEEIAKLLGCNQGFVGELVDVGILVPLKFGGRRRFRKVTFNKFLEEFDGEDLYEIVRAKKIARTTAG